MVDPQPKRVLVTGGAKGIGRAIPTKLASSGWKVTICGRDRTSFEELGRQGIEALAVDLRSPAAIDVLARDWEEHGLPIALVCNAGSYGELGKLESVRHRCLAEVVRPELFFSGASRSEVRAARSGRSPSTRNETKDPRAEWERPRERQGLARDLRLLLREGGALPTRRRASRGALRAWVRHQLPGAGRRSHRDHGASHACGRCGAPRALRF